MPGDNAAAVPLLVVEDDAEMGELLRRGLSEEGYLVDVVGDGLEALIQSQATPYPVAVLDVMLPGMSGFEVCRRLRDANPGILILMLTARDDVDDRVRGLDAGADDYLVKPFAFVELAARLRALRRREGLPVNPLIELGNLIIDSHNHRVSVRGKSLHLSPKEFALLRLLAQNANATVSRETILLEVWETTVHTDANIVDQYVSYLRKKLDLVPTGIELTTVRGIGFQISTGS